jgi:hypothetical protein
MAKKKKKLSEIKDALLSKTSYLKNNEEPIEIAAPAENLIEIDKQVFSKIKVLAGYYGNDSVEVVNEALTHFLRLKKLDIDEALKNMVVGSADDE